MRKKLLFLVVILLLSIYPVHADNYLPINYKKTIYSQENGLKTTVYWAKIPKKYKPMLGLANDSVLEISDSGKIAVSTLEPSINAQNHNATLAINLGHWHGIVVNDGELLRAGVNEIRGHVVNYGDTLYMDKKGNLHALKNSMYDADDLMKLNPVWAVKGFFAIVKDNKFITEYDDEEAEYVKKRHPRTFIGQMTNGTYFVGVSEGRTSMDAGLTLEEIYEFVQKYISNNIKIIYLGDGGGSSGFIYKGKKINKKIDDNFTTERKTPNIIYFGKKNSKSILNNNNYSNNTPKKTLKIDRKLDKNGKKVLKLENIYDGISISKFLSNIDGDNKRIKILNGNGLQVEDGTLKNGYVLKTSANEYDIAIVGDASGDGYVSKDDVKKIMRHVLDDEKIDNDNLQTADINQDGVINMNDAYKILKYMK